MKGGKKHSGQEHEPLKQTVLGLNYTVPFIKLCDFSEVSEPLWASVSLPIKKDTLSFAVSELISDQGHASQYTTLPAERNEAAPQEQCEGASQGPQKLLPGAQKPKAVLRKRIAVLAKRRMILL